MFRIDPARSEPLFEQLADQVRVAVARGRLAAGDRLPAARDVAQSLDLNVHTVLHAYQELRDEGTIELRRGRGAVVTGHGAADLAAVHEAVDALVRAATAARLAPGTVTTLLKEAMRP